MLRTVKQIKNLKGKRVLVRVDFNVPVKNGQVTDDFKIIKSLPTIEYLLKKGAKVVIMSHLGRPKGKVTAELRLTAPVKRLSELLLKKIKKLPVSTGERVIKEIKKMKPADILFLENIQFEPGEITNDEKLAKVLASYGDYFVNECFAQSHRDYASISKIARYIPAYAGLLLAEEIADINKVTSKPQKPFVVILGGAKVETKIPVLEKLLPMADHILVGGEIFNTYLWARGNQVGASLVDKKFKKQALLYGSKKKVIMPVDVVVGKENGDKVQVLPVSEVRRLKSEVGIYDIGPATVRLFAKYIKNANTLIWNGAMGYFEQHPYEYGTNAIARLVASRSKGKAFGICGGGETVEVLRKLNLIADIDLVSTGGGAMLEFLSGKKLPGVEAVRGI